MPNVKHWIEVQDECFGPERREDSGWEYILFVCRCRSYSRHDGTLVVNRKRNCMGISATTRAGAHRALRKFIHSPGVTLLEAKAAANGASA